MFLIVESLKPYPSEDFIAWNVRRCKSAHKFVRVFGLCSHKWFNRAVKWHEHVCRHPEMIIHPLLEWRGKEWPQERRQTFLPLMPRESLSF